MLAFLPETLAAIDGVEIKFPTLACSLCENYLEAEGAASVADMLKVNKTITSLECAEMLLP